MEQYMKQFRQRHKLLSYILGLGVIIFFNCFGFPIINLNKEWSMMLTAIKIYVVLGGALFSGGGNVKKWYLSWAFSKKEAVLYYSYNIYYCWTWLALSVFIGVWRSVKHL